MSLEDLNAARAAAGSIAPGPDRAHAFAAIAHAEATDRMGAALSDIANALRVKVYG